LESIDISIYTSHFTLSDQPQEYIHILDATDEYIVQKKIQIKKAGLLSGGPHCIFAPCRGTSVQVYSLLIRQPNRAATTTN